MWSTIRGGARRFATFTPCIAAGGPVAFPSRAPAAAASEPSTLPSERSNVREQLERIAILAGESGNTDELLAKIQALEEEWWCQGKVHRVVLTGGPCAGKSTVMTDIKEMLRESNFLVFTMPEVATEMFKWSDCKMWDDFSAEGSEDDKVWAELQVTLTKVQMTIEDSILQMARRSLQKRRKSETPPHGVVILLDRGVVDNLAYCTKEAWAMVLEELGTTTARLRDGRYDHVIHLVTAANGAEQYYSLVQAESGDVHEQSARTETAEQAKALDLRTQDSWKGAKSHYIINNAGANFDEKREKVKHVVRTIIGERAASGVQRLECEFLSFDRIGSLCDQDPDIPWKVCMNVTFTYLSSDTRLQRRLVKRQGIAYYHQTLNADRRVSRQYQMDSWTYMQKLRAAKAGRQAELALAGAPSSMHSDELKEIHVDRVMFAYKDTMMRCHCLPGDTGRDPMLIVEVMDPHLSVSELPRWLQVTSKDPGRFYDYARALG